MNSGAVELYVRHVQAIPVAEQLRLLAMIAQGLGAVADEIKPRATHDIMDLYGTAQGRGVGMDAQEYVQRLRDGRSVFPDEA